MGALMGWSAHVWIRIYDCWLEWRSRPVGLFVRTVIDRQVLRRRCVVPAAVPLPADLVGPYVTRDPVGSYGMLSPCNSVYYPDQPVADGLGPYVARGTVGSYGMLSRVTLTLILISRWLMARWARMLHVARWARMGCYPHVTLTLIQISMLLMARGSVCYTWSGGLVLDVVPRVTLTLILISRWLMARGARMLHVGLYEMMSPSDSDADQPLTDGPVDLYVACGPVGSCEMLSPCISEFDPDRPVADSPVGSYVTRGPVGSYGMLSPCDSDTTGPVMPVERTLPRSPHGGGECMDMHDGWSGSNVTGTHTSVAVVDLRAGSTVSDVSSNGGDDGEDWDSGYQREIFDGVTIYYGGDLCESDSEDSEDVARREYVEDYNFDLLEGMEPMVFVPSGKTSGFYRQNEYQSYLYDGNDARVPDGDSIVDRECRTWREYWASIFRKGLAPFPWLSCGGARCHGVRCGRATHRIVWIMLGGFTISLGLLRRPTWSSVFRRGLFIDKCGRIR